MIIVEMSFVAFVGTCSGLGSSPTGLGGGLGLPWTFSIGIGCLAGVGPPGDGVAMGRMTVDGTGRGPAENVCWFEVGVWGLGGRKGLEIGGDWAPMVCF